MKVKEVNNMPEEQAQKDLSENIEKAEGKNENLEAERTYTYPELLEEVKQAVLQGYEHGYNRGVEHGIQKGFDLKTLQDLD